MVDEDDVVMAEGVGPWDNTSEDPPASGETCRICFGTIEPGSKRYCPACKVSGNDIELREQLRLAGTPARTMNHDGHRGGKA